MLLAPTFRATWVGLDIGSTIVRAVALRRRRAGWSLIVTGEEPVTFPARPGELMADRVAVSHAIRQLIERLRLPRTRIVAALTGRAAIVKRLTVAAIGPAALAEAMPWEAEPYIPFDLSDVQLDYQVLGPTVAASGAAQDVVFVAARKDRIDDRTALINQAGHDVAVLDVEAFALTNAHELNYPDHADDLTMLLHVGGSATVICLLVRGRLAFTRDISIGGRVYGDARQREPGVDAGTAEGVDAASSQLVLEVRKTVDFYRAAAPVEKLGRILLSGGACEAAGLSELLRAEFAAPVDLFDPVRKISRAEADSPRPPLGPAYAVAVGLALRREAVR